MFFANYQPRDMTTRNFNCIFVAQAQGNRKNNAEEIARESLYLRVVTFVVVNQPKINTYQFVCVLSHGNTVSNHTYKMICAQQLYHGQGLQK